MKARYLSAGLLALTLVCLFASCQKEVNFQNDTVPIDPNNPNPPAPLDIKGNWTFIDQSGNLKVDFTATQSGVQITGVINSEFASSENAGDVTITDNQFQFVGLGSHITGNSNVKTYLGPVLLDESNTPLDESTTPGNANLDYTKNTADSLTFPNGFPGLPDTISGVATSTISAPVGARIIFSNDTMILNLRSVFKGNVTQEGVPAKVDVLTNAVVKFKKK